jgi:putative FmdB family regulatory protein
MPFYEYECSACSHHTEVLQKISDAPLKKCPECGKQTLKRLMSAPVFRLKGGGWYETDFKSDNETKRNLAGKDDAEPASEDKKSESSDSSGSETKSSKKVASVSARSSGSSTKAKPAKPAAKAKPKAKAAKAKAKAKKRR